MDIPNKVITEGYPKLMLVTNELSIIDYREVIVIGMIVNATYPYITIPNIPKSINALPTTNYKYAFDLDSAPHLLTNNSVLEKHDCLVDDTKTYVKILAIYEDLYFISKPNDLKSVGNRPYLRETLIANFKYILKHG